MIKIQPAVSGLLVALSLLAPHCGGVKRTMPGNDERTLFCKPNLDKIKRFILTNGETCTYSQMYNNNPCFSTEKYSYYLLPDPGGPVNHPQWNGNCDPGKGDFNTLIIRKNANADSLDVNQYGSIEFIDPDHIQVDGEAGERANRSAVLKAFPGEAIKELLAIIGHH